MTELTWEPKLLLNTDHLESPWWTLRHCSSKNCHLFPTALTPFVKDVKNEPKLRIWMKKKKKRKAIFFPPPFYFKYENYTFGCCTSTFYESQRILVQKSRCSLEKEIWCTTAMVSGTSSAVWPVADFSRPYCGLWPELIMYELVCEWGPGLFGDYMWASSEISVTVKWLREETSVTHICRSIAVGALHHTPIILFTSEGSYGPPAWPTQTTNAAFMVNLAE